MIDWTKTRVCVIGGAGMIGRPLVEMLLALGAKVTVFDLLLRAGHQPMEYDAPAGVRFVKGDAADSLRVKRAMAGCGVVFNLAANVAGITHNMEYPAKMFTDNVVIKLGVYEAIQRSDVHTYVDVSTACVYPAEAPVPTPESFVLPIKGPWSPEASNFGYGIAKLCGEFLAAYLPMRTIIVRFSNSYGPSDYFGPGCHVIPALIQRMAGGENPLKLWGGGNQSRTFIYSEDAALALIELAERAPDKTVCNVGVNETVTIFGLAGLIADALEIEQLQFDEDMTRPRGYFRRVPDLTVARQLDLTCTREWVRLKDGIGKVVEWWRTQPASGLE